MLKAFAVWKLAVALVFGISLWPALAAGQSCDAVSQWRQWDKTLSSSVNLAASGGNPYRDYIVRVTFSNSSTGESFTQDAFWDNDPLAPTVFKVRAALRPGSWTWGGDAAWAAPPREIKGQTAMWNSYLQARKSAFTVLQIAPAVTWQPERNPPEFTPLPLAPGFSFDQTGCSSADPLPNTCSRPIKAYWDTFDDMIRRANEQDFVVLVAGLIDPIDRGSGGRPYPKVQDMKSFARFLAARLAGRQVLFSPGFDDRVGNLTADGQTVATAMEQVGQAIKAASPRHLVTNHLAGSSLCSAYEGFRRQDLPGQPLWMTFFRLLS